MSLEAITWAYAQRLEHSVDKFVLVTLCNWANEVWEAYPSVAGIEDKTGLNRKTIIASYARLKAAGFIEDTGDRKGRTKQIVVWRVVKESQKRNSTKNGTVPFLDVSSTENGTVKESQKRDTDTKDKPYTKEDTKDLPATVPLAGGDHHAEQLDLAGHAPQTAKKPKAEKPKTDALWRAYSDAYFARYGTEPVRNARVNGQLAKVIELIGANDAPHVAAFYVGHQGRFYLQKCHPVGLLVSDAEGLRTQWATGRAVTSANAAAGERLGSNVMRTLDQIDESMPFGTKP